MAQSPDDALKTLKTLVATLDARIKKKRDNNDIVLSEKIKSTISAFPAMPKPTYNEEADALKKERDDLQKKVTALKKKIKDYNAAVVAGKGVADKAIGTVNDRISQAGKNEPDPKVYASLKAPLAVLKGANTVSDTL